MWRVLLPTKANFLAHIYHYSEISNEVLHNHVPQGVWKVWQVKIEELKKRNFNFDFLYL